MDLGGHQPTLSNQTPNTAITTSGVSLAGISLSDKRETAQTVS